MRRRFPLLLIVPFFCALISGCGPQAGSKVTFDAPADLAKKTEIPMYPESSAPDGRSKAPFEDPNGATRVELILTTPADVKKVAEFYTIELGWQAVSEGTSTSLMGKTKSGNDGIIRITRPAEAKETEIKINAIVYSDKKS